MPDMMNFPPTFEEFIKEYEFIDKEEIYTNKAELIPSFRVMQAWEYYTDNIKSINQNIDNIFECLRTIENNIIDIEETVDEI